MTRPRDPDLIRADLLEAAVASYTDGGSFSVRDVAGRAGVNHAQIKHLFGSKDDLKKAMLEHMARDMLRRVYARSPADVAEMVRAAAETQLEDGGRFARALARHLLESHTPESHTPEPHTPEPHTPEPHTRSRTAPQATVAQDEFPVVDEALAILSTFPASQQPALKRILAERLALALGWSLFEPWIRKATRLEDDIADALKAGIGAMPDLEDL